MPRLHHHRLGRLARRIYPFLPATLLLILTACSTGQKPEPMPTHGPTVTPDANWKLVWSDEFNGADGSPVDPNKWSFNLGAGGWGNKEKENYTNRTENIRQEGGSLVIEARKESYQSSDYTSARIFSINGASWTYGRFEARARLPAGQGIWPAIWMLPTEGYYGPWPASGEIDIMELIGKEPSRVYGTLHFGKPHQYPGGSFDLTGGKTFSDDYHIFAIEWDQKEIRWYVDGYEYFKVDQWSTSSAKGKFPAPFDRAFHWVLNVAVGGSWPGDPDQTTPFPARMVVDYVRVYQK